MGTDKNRYLVLAALLPLECILSLILEIAVLVMEDIRISWYRHDPQFYPYGFDANLYAGLTVTLYILMGLKCVNIWNLICRSRKNMNIQLWVRLTMLKLGVIVWTLRTMMFCRQRFGDDITFKSVTALYYSFNTIIGSGITMQAIEVIVNDQLRQNPYQVFYRRWTYCRLPLRKLNVAMIGTLMTGCVYNSLNYAVHGAEQLSKWNGIGNFSSFGLLSTMLVFVAILVGGILNVAGIRLRNERMLFLAYVTMQILSLLAVVLLIFTSKLVKLNLKPTIVIGFVTAGMKVNGLAAICDMQLACMLRWVTYMRLQRILPIGDANLGQSSCFQNKDDIPKQRVHMLENLYVQMPWRLKTTGEMLGEGHFSKVYKVDIRGICSGKPKVLAAKEIQADYLDDEDYASALVSEIKTVQALGKHANLVEFAGLYNIKPTGGIGILLEFCENGSLLDHLRIMRDEEGFTPGSKVFQDCLKWSNGIAAGMEYLHSRKVVHGDLSTRNILLDRNMVCKISDFGMSFKLYTYETYKRTEQKPLPFRWMPPEVLVDYKFSLASDVWAYGVTLWEIFSLGDVPWGTCCFDGKFVRKIRIEGKRLERPKLCPDTIYASIFLKCWELEPHVRLDATGIVTELQDYINAKSCGEIQLNISTG